MSGRKKTILIAVSVFAILLAGLSAFLIVYNQPRFTGKRVKNSDAYTLDIRRMNGSDSHTLTLTDGDVLQVEFETEKGSLHMEITAPDGNVIYTGNGKETTKFEIGISENGAYTVKVEARHAKGKINIRLKEKKK